MRLYGMIVAFGATGVVLAQTELLAPTLAELIITEREAALERGVEPIPPDVRAALTGFVAEEVLDKVRWRVDADAASFYPAFFTIGATPAVTLDYVVIFAAVEHARDPSLWAHEIHHVGQYRAWGIDGFADRYLADYQAVEHEANEFHWQWTKATGRIPAPGSR